jgi:hypothetical protein
MEEEISEEELSLYEWLSSQTKELWGYLVQGVPYQNISSMYDRPSEGSQEQQQGIKFLIAAPEYQRSKELVVEKPFLRFDLERFEELWRGLPAIQEMQAEQRFCTERAREYFDQCDDETQRAVRQVMKVFEKAQTERDKPPYDWFHFESIRNYCPLESENPDDLTQWAKGRIHDFLAIIPAMDSDVSGKASDENSPALGPMEGIARQAAGAFGSAVQRFQHLIGMGRDHTQ